MDKELAKHLRNSREAKSYLDSAFSVNEFTDRLNNVVKAHKIAHKKTAWKMLAKSIDHNFWTVGRFSSPRSHIGYTDFPKVEAASQWADLCIKLTAFGKGKPEACKSTSDIKEVMTSICKLRVYHKRQHKAHDFKYDSEMLHDVFSKLDLSNEKACKKFVRSFLSLFNAASL